MSACTSLAIIILRRRRPPVPLSPSLFYDVDIVADQERISQYWTDDDWGSEPADLQSHYDMLAKECPPVILSPTAFYDESHDDLLTKEYPPVPLSPSAYYEVWDWERIVANADLSGHSRGTFCGSTAAL